MMKINNVVSLLLLLTLAYGFSSLDIDQDYVDLNWNTLSQHLETIEEIQMDDNDLT